MENQVNVGDQNSQQNSQNGERGKRSNSPILRVIFLLALLVVVVGVVNIAGKKGKNFLRPSTVSAAEIIRRNLEKFIKPNTIYHQKTKQYLGGNNEPNTYEIWEDQESERFYNEATYSDGRKTVQGFNLEFRWDIDYQTKTIHKDIYVYEPQSGPQPVGRRVDIAEQFDDLIHNGVLETKEGKLDGREVYVIYDTRTSPEKYWDILTFDKKNFQILQTEKYGADKKLEELEIYETQEAVERTEESLAKFFTYQKPDGDFAFYQRSFYTSKPDQEEYVLVSGTPQGPQSTVPVATSAFTPSPEVTFTPTLRTSNPPKINISYPSEMQSIEFTSPDQKLCVIDTPAGGDTSGLQRKHNLNDDGWSGYSDIFTLCFDPKEGFNRLQLQYRNKYGEESVMYTRQFNFHRIQEINISLSGQLYRDENCNGIRDGGESGIGTSATINIFKMPEFYIYSTINTDDNGNYSFSGKIKENETLTLKPAPVSPSGYKSNPHYTEPSLTFGSSNRSTNLDMPQVPNENVGTCY